MRAVPNPLAPDTPRLVVGVVLTLSVGILGGGVWYTVGLLVWPAEPVRHGLGRLPTGLSEDSIMVRVW